MQDSLQQGNGSSGQDKRRFQRFEVGMPVLVRQILNEQGHVLAVRNDLRAAQRMALCRDLSMTGLFFLSAMRYNCGDVVEIQLTLGARTHKLNGVVVRTQIQRLPGRESYGCGIQFVKSPAIDTALPAIASYLRSRFKSIGAPKIVRPAAPAAASGLSALGESTLAQADTSDKAA